MIAGGKDGMIVGMTPRKEKIAVTLRPELVDHARQRVESGQAASVSAYVEEALEAKVLDDDFGDLLTEMLAETGGPLTPDERAAADRVLGR
jgi:Arc/MetJ-type ribon-helix-helix transcriptional regulator